MKLSKRKHNSDSVRTQTAGSSLRRDFLLCALIVFVSIFLHSLSRATPYVPKDSRDEYRTEDGLPYLTEMDSYLYCRLTEEIVDGETTISLRHSRGDDPYISANATGEEGDVVMGLPVLGATVYKLLSWIPGVTPYGVIYWLPAIIASLTAIPVFAFVRRQTNRLGGLVAAVTVVTAAPFAWYTHTGFYDTNMGLCLLPCLFLLCLAEAMLAKSLRRQILWAAGSGLSLCALSTFWRAYYAYFCIGAAAAFCAMAAVGVYQLVQRIRCRRAAQVVDGQATDNSDKSAKSDSSNNSSPFLRVLRGAGIGLGAQVLCCLLIRGKEFFEDLTEIFGNVGGSLANGDRAFPDAANYVSELQSSPLLATDYGEKWYDRLLNGFAAYPDGSLNLLGGWLVLLVAATVVAFLVYSCVKAVFFNTSCRVEQLCGESSTEDSATEITYDTPASAPMSSVPMLRTPSDLLVTAVFLCVWLGCGVIIMLKGSRFISIAALPTGVLCGIGFGLFSTWLHRSSAFGSTESSDKTDDSDSSDLSESSDKSDFSASLSTFRTVLYIGMVLLGAAGCAFAFRPQFGWLACGIAGAVALALGFAVFGLRRKAVINFFALAVVLAPCMACTGGAYGAIPDGTDTLQNMCDYIRENTEDDAVIASWWDYGYFYEYAAKRLTLGDGGNFNSEWNYWLGQALMSGDETLSKGIFRMLSEGGLDALHLLMDAYTDGTAGVPHNPDYVLPDDLCSPPGYATTILKRILPLPRDEAREVLTSGYALPQTTTDELLALTHPANPRPIYVVLSEDMLRKIGAISDFGTWDFTKSATVPLIARNLSAAKIDLTATGDYNIPLDSYNMSVRVTVSTAGLIRSVKLVDDKTGRTYSSACRIISGRALKDPLFADKEIVDMADVSGETSETATSIPTFAPTTETYTIYLREDEPGQFRCIVCSSFAADTVLIRGMTAKGDALCYRDIRECKNPDGMAELHEVSVWNLGR